ncbi:MAG TPA: hypothetical protein VIK35_10340 [Verrucomicrobiae bacterium]
MNCPHCQKELPENYGAAWCPFCGKNLPPEYSKPLQESPAVKFNWRLFLCALLFPALATLLSAATMRFLMLKPMNEGVSPWVGLIGSAIGGVICGVMLGFQGSKKFPVRILLSILMSAVMIIVCIMLCLFGCGIGGYQMRFG